ncbi:hypothetical protein MBLNU13_g09891t1 [Cladosporium sp. NU13]
MVATRRGARTDHTEEPEPQNESLTLRKKPVRRATAATAATSAKAAQPTTRTRATRSKMVEEDDEDELAQPQQPQETSEEPKPVTKRATRSKRAETVEPEPSRATRSAKPAAQPKRATRTTSAKLSEAAQESQSAQTAPAATAKPALAARPTRQTRTKATAAQRPLSPKKITQVSRARTRGAKVAEDEKEKPTQSTRPASRTSRTSRKRAVSDENAGIPELSPVEPTVALAQPILAQPIKANSPSKTSPVAKQAIEEEEPLSSRQTTPPGSPEPEFEQPKDYTEDKIDAADLEQTDDEDEKGEQSASDDELSGPKTPMRRTRQTRSQVSVRPKSSAKRQDPDVPAHTPPRRRVARGATPQTQKLCDRTAASGSVVRPMTVARAIDRPFVFRKLEKDSKSVADLPAEPVAEDDEAETQAEETEEQGQTSEDDVDMAELEDETHAHTGDGHAHDPEETILVDEDSADEHQDLDLADSPSVNPPLYSYENLEDLSDEESTPMKPQASEEDMDDDDSSLLEPPEAEYEDEDGMEVDSPTAEPPVASYEVDADGSVIVHSKEGSDSGESSEDEHDDCTMFGLKTPRPETIPWQNIREDTTIPIDFDLHFAGVRTPARVYDDFSYGATPAFQNMHSGVDEPMLEPNHDFDQMNEEPTMNLNDFVDIAALSEPTMHLDTLPSAVPAKEKEASECEPVPSEVDDTESTVIIKSTDSTVPVAFEEEEQAGPYDTPQPSEKLRSGMMRESLERSVAGNDQIQTATTASSYDADEVLEEVDESVPHYALPTLSSRRKSLPALGNQTPVRFDARPKTSDGSSIARIARPFDQSWWARSRRSSVAAIDTVATPVRGPRTRRSSSVKRSTAVIETPSTQTGERFPRRAPRDWYDSRFEAQTVAAPSRFWTPSHGPARYPATVQKMAYQQSQQVPTKGQSKPSTPGSVRKFHHGEASEQGQSFNVPFRTRAQVTTPVQQTPTAQEAVSQESSETTNSTAAPSSHATPGERFPRRSARQTYDQQARTAASPARFHTPIQGKPRRPATAQRLASQSASQTESSPRHITPKQTPRGSKSQTKPSAATPEARFPRLPSKEEYDMPVDAEPKQQPSTPKERFPRLPPKQAYDERASTVIAPSRFRSPAHASPRRPATSQKPVNLRKVALKAAAPGYGSHTPIKTPLKAPAETPSQVPMTPHPGAPLRGVVALVEVFTLDGASASAPFISLLQRLGARTTKAWSERVTHVIFKDGSPTTLQRVRLNNKEVESTRKGFIIHCVNSRWVSDCDASGSRVDEDDDAYAVDVTDVPRGGNRRRKSMEPSALINIGGNIVRDRKSSGRQSIGRSAMKLGSSEKRSENDVEFTPVAKWTGVPDDDDFEDDESEISTPDYLAAPDKLIQMTAPANRVRKLDLQKDASKNRRMTSFWEGGD